MNDVAITVENLGKEYRIGSAAGRHDTLRDALSGILRRPRIHTSHSDNQSNQSDRFWALRDVSFDVKRGEVVGVIGRNGAGKSTLLKILSRITEPTTGRAIIHGRVGSLLEVGTGFHPELTGRENIYLNGAILGMRRAEIDRRFDEIVAFAEIDRFLDTPVKRYSSGMYVRLAFAVAAHLEPEILLVDEVLSVGDAAFQKKCLGKMSDVAGEGRTVLFVSHNMAAVRAFCPHAVLVENGSIASVGPSSDVVADYLRRMSRNDGGTQEAEYHFGKDDSRGRQTYMQWLRLSDESGATTRRFLMGQPMTIEIGSKGVSPRSQDEYTVVFSSVSGETLCTTNSRMSADVPDLRYDREVATLYVPRVPFTPGQYIIDLAVYRPMYGWVESISRAAEFEVLEYDVYGTGYQVRPDQGYFYLDAGWRIVDDPQKQSDPSDDV